MKNLKFKMGWIGKRFFGFAGILSMTLRTERGQLCPQKPLFRNLRTWLSALLPMADSWPRSAGPATHLSHPSLSPEENVPAVWLRMQWLLIFTFAFLILNSPSVLAALPEPDNVLYGQIVISNQLITAARTDVVIEARRTLNGPAIASYTMGSDPKLTNLYSLRLALEAFTPVSDGNSTLVGDALVIVLRDATGVLGQKNYVIGARGTTLRTDFVIASTDGDLNGMPDAWELANFGGAVNPNADPDGDGRSNLQEFIAGTNPNVKDGFKVLVAKNGNQTQVSFVALSATGLGYEGKTRYYSIEATTNLTGNWSGVSSYTNIVGSNQSVVYLSPVTNTPTFYRGKVWLQGF